MNILIAGADIPERMRKVIRKQGIGMTNPVQLKVSFYDTVNKAIINTNTGTLVQNL